MSKIKLSDYVAKRLKEHGVKHFFMVSGGGAMLPTAHPLPRHLQGTFPTTEFPHDGG